MNNDHLATFHGRFLTIRDIIADHSIIELAGYDHMERVAMLDMAHHAADFLARSNSLLGRSGPVCPFITGAIRGSHLHMAASRIGEHDAEALLACAEQMLEACDRLTAGISKITDRFLASLIVVFPRLHSSDGIAALERAQKLAKPRFVELGYMIGEFYPGNTTGGLHNPYFRPLDTPAPSFAVRHMHLSDAPFMLGDERFEAAFARRFGAEGEQRLVELRGCEQALPAQNVVLTPMIQAKYLGSDHHGSRP